MNRNNSCENHKKNTRVNKAQDFVQASTNYLVLNAREIG